VASKDYLKIKDLKFKQSMSVVLEIIGIKNSYKRNLSTINEINC
jgi:hypothetical protein